MPAYDRSRTEPDRPEAIVVGAGLAGLACARRLAEAGRRVVVLEAGDGVGGRVRSDRVDGFTLDRGFQVALTSYPELAAQLDLEALELRRFDPGALVFTGRRCWRVGDPLRRPGDALASALAPIGTPADKARLALLLLRLRRTDPRTLLRQPDRTTAAAIEALGFTSLLTERFLRPLFGGIQLDPALTTSSRMFSVILRALATGYGAVPAAGMGAIPAQLATALPAGTVRLGCRVLAVEPGAARTAGGDRLEARYVVVATDGPVAAGLLGLPPVASRPATSVWFAAAASPVAGRRIVLDGTGAGPAHNVAVLSNVAPEYAPSGHTLVVAACPGAARPDVAPDVQAQLRRWWGPAVDGWRHLRTDVVDHAQPGSSPPFSPRRPVALGEGLFVCGDHRDTPSIQGALFSGRRCADAVLAALAASA